MTAQENIYKTVEIYGYKSEIFPLATPASTRLPKTVQNSHGNSSEAGVTDVVRPSGLSIINRNTETYADFKELYDKEAFIVKAVDDKLVGAYNKFEHTDFVVLDLQFLSSNIGDIHSTHAYLLNELNANENLGDWGNSLADEFTSAISKYSVTDTLRLSEINCRKTRCVTTINFDNVNEEAVAQFFKELNQDPNYPFYVLPFYNTEAYEGTLVIVRTKNT